MLAFPHSMRVKISLLIVAICVSVLLFSCNRPAGPPPRKLLIYTPHGQDLLREFTALYKVKEPEVEVQFLDMGAREILERVRAERNRPQADLWWGAAHTTFQTAADENLLAPYRPSWADQIAGSNYVNLNIGYLKQVGRMPDVVGGNIYVGSWLETGSAWDKWHEKDWRNNVTVGAILESLLGPIFLGGSFNSGHARFYVVVGPLFR